MRVSDNVKANLCPACLIPPDTENTSVGEQQTHLLLHRCKDTGRRKGGWSDGRGRCELGPLGFSLVSLRLSPLIFCLVAGQPFVPL